MAGRGRELPHKAALRRCYTRFIEDLDPIPILDHFITHDFLPITTIRDIKESMLTITEKNRRIMEKVMTKDESGYRIFLKCLKDTHQPYLASQLEEQYRKLVEEAKRAAGQTNQRLGAPNYRVESPKPVNKNNADKNPERPLPRLSTPSTVPSQAPSSHSLPESRTPQRSIFPSQPRPSPSVTPSPTAQSSPNHPPAHYVSNQLQTSPSVATERRHQGSDVSDQSQPNLSLSQYLPSPLAPGSEISNQSQPNPSLNRLHKDPSVATGRRPQGSDVSDQSQPNLSLNRLHKDPSVATGRRPQGSDVSDQSQPNLSLNRLHKDPSVATGRRPQGSDVSDQSQPNLSLSQYLPSPLAPGRQGSEISNQSQPNLSLSQHLPSPLAPGSEISNQSQPNPSLNRLHNDPTVATGRRPQGSDVSNRFPHDHVTSPSPAAVTSTAARPEGMGDTFPQDPTSSLVRVGFPDTSRSGSSPQSHSGNQPGPNNLMSGMGGNDMFPPPVLVSGQQQSNIDSTDSAEHLVNLPHESATPSPSTKHTSGPQLDTGSESRQHGANLTQEPTATSPSNERTAGSQLDAGSGSQHGFDHQDAGTTAVKTDSSIHDTRGSRPISHPVQDNKDQNTGHRLAMVDTQSSGQGQLTGHAVTEARTNILLTSTGQSPGSGESSGATRQQIDVGNRRTVSGIHPSGSGSPEQVLDNPVVPSTSNNDAVNTKPVRCATLAGTEKRVVIKVPHDGRILDITEKFVKQFIPKEGEKKGKFGYEVGKGGYGTVYGSNDKQPDMDMHIVIKKISCHVDETKRRSATNEILAARLMHFAIVPLLGMCEDKDHTMYFLFPFLEKGDLYIALGNDRSNIENMLEVCLKRDIRLKIIYQIASAMEFIHTKVEAFRGAYVHGDIKSKNIVLDGKYNARLTDFGLARELKDNGSLTMTSSGNYGTEGYFVTGLKQDLTIRRDCCSFGVVLLELLTSFQPVDNTGELKKKKNLLTYKKSQIEAVWKDTSMYRGIHEIAQSCLDINIEYTAGCILEKFKELTRNKFRDDDKFHEEELTNPAKCQVCMLNPAMARDYQGNHDYCIKLRVCVACLRNSYFNPIKCHTCGNDIQSPIGNGWGAILVAGNDEDCEDTAKLFEEDMKLMYTTISSKCPHLMGISERFIKRVSPSKPGTEESLREQFEAAFEALRSLDEIHTLLFFFSGHYSVTRGFRLGSRMDSVTKEEVTDELIQCKHVKKRIIFLDCCDAPVFDSKKFPKDTTLQLNACDESSGEKSHLHGDWSCSPFVLFLVQGIWHGAWPKACFLSTIPNPGHCGEICKVYKESPTTDHLISFANLKDYVGKHMTYMSKQQTPVHHVDAKRFTQDKVAYHIDKCSELKFYFRDDLHECDTKRREVVYTCKSLPDSVQELIKDLMQEFLQKDPSARSLSKYSDVICVVMTTGPKLEHYREFDTIPKLVAAWNGKRRLHYGFRKLENLQLGRVGIFLETEKKESARIIHYFLERVGITVKEPQVQGHQHDVVKIERKEVKNVFDALQKVDAEEKRASQERLQVILEALDQQEEDGGWLYFTFPYETGTTRPNERFLVVEYRTPKSNSQA